MRDVVATALGDRAWQRALGASCLLHGAVLAALIFTWHIEPKLPTARPPIPVTLVRSDDAAPSRAAPPVEEVQRAEQAKPVEPAREEHAPPPAIPAEKPAPPQTLAATARDAVAKSKAAPALVLPTPAPKPSDAITALLSESLDGRPRRGSAPNASRAIALRSSAKLSEDYLLRLQAWIAREERYPAEARAEHREGKGVVGFTIARDGKVTRAWIDQSTGSPLLDQASLATIRDASPVPPLPHDLSGTSVDFYLPVDYSLSNFERLFQ